MAPSLSVVVVAYDMARELPRTLASLGSVHQHANDPEDTEIIVVDNGSPEPLEVGTASGTTPVRLVRIEDAPPSPAHAANVGLAAAQGELVGLLVDGARMASPGLLAGARRAARLAHRVIVATLGWHLGPLHMDAAHTGYDQTTEDRLLDDCDWEHDPYRLFSVSTLAASSSRGWFGPLGESNALFLPAALWQELGGMDEHFALPGGGLVNHDLYARACALEDAELVLLLGEGTFHQTHGGAATSGSLTWAEMNAEYEKLRGEAYRPPNRRPLLLGRVHETAVPHLRASIERATHRWDHWWGTP